MPPRTEPRLAAAIALTRFGLGAETGEIDAVASDPIGWLESQIQPEGAPNPAGAFANTADRIQAFLDYQQHSQAARQVQRTMAPEPADGAEATAGQAADPQVSAAIEARRESRRSLTQDTSGEFLARAQLAATTKAGFAERWALFWANAFTVSAMKFEPAIFLGQYEREAIRPHVFGRFEDLAVAAETHPAMLLYLDQTQSIGPNSQAGQRRRQAGLNENLAREIMELHTVGAEGGYSQADVIEFARSLTGWSIPNGRDGGERPLRAALGGRPRAMQAVANEPGDNGFVFRANVHEPGARTVLGKTYETDGARQGEAILRDLANRPETRQRLAHNLARHFVADDPPKALVDRLEAAWTESRGDLAAVARALIAAPDAWDPRPGKIKTPYEFIVSSHRALGVQPERPQPLQQALIRMGQPAFSAPSPEGWPDTAADWAGPDAMVKRLNWAKTVADAARAGDPDAVAAGALGARLSERSRMAVARAESRSEALTLFLMSPEFQRR